MTARYCLCLTAAAVAAAILAGGCARQTRNDMHVDLKEYSNPFAPGGCLDDPSEFKGSGDVTIYQNRQKASARLDVRSKADGYFSAQLYSPFGTAIAAVDASDFRGSINIDRERREFGYGDTMFGLPFPGAGRITFAELINIVTTGVPGPARKLPRDPVSAARDKKSVTVVWVDEAVEARVKISASRRNILAVTFQYNVADAAYTIELNRVKDGAAKEISIRDVISGNYITIKYDTVKTVKKDRTCCAVPP